MKKTIWQEIDATEAIKIEKYPDTPDSIKVWHPKLKRPRYFYRSLKGNWYSRYTGKGIDPYAEGYILINYV